MNNGKICVSVCAETADEMIKNIKRAEEFADVIEVRFDCLDRNEFDTALQKISELKCDKPFLATFRPENGHANLTPVRRIYKNEEEKELHFAECKYRLDGWGKIAVLPGVEYMDFEYDIHSLLVSNLAFSHAFEMNCDREHKLALQFKERQLVLSEHHFSNEIIDLESAFDRLSRKVEINQDEAEELFLLNPDIVKIAVHADDITDAIPVWKLLDRAKAENKQIIPIAMGEVGKWTRVLGLAHGAFMAYASLDAGKETADGQITANELVETYRVKELDEQTTVFGVIGDPVSQSLSPYMHNPAFVKAGMNAVFIPLLVKNLDEFIRRMVRPETREVELNFGGFSVTMPHKVVIMRHLDETDETAEKIGAVNTVKIRDGKLIGYNTDAHGFITPLKAKFGNLRDARVAVFGAGGAARACVYALTQEGAEVTAFARDEQKTRTFADKFGVRSSLISKLKVQRSKTGLFDFDILVNATPLGMKGEFEHESLFSADQLKGVKFVYDLVTKSVDTPIIREAKKANIPAIGGLEMLVAQGTKQFEIWTGQEAPVDEMKQSVLARMQGQEQ